MINMVRIKKRITAFIMGSQKVCLCVWQSKATKSRLDNISGEMHNAFKEKNENNRILDSEIGCAKREAKEAVSNKAETHSCTPEIYSLHHKPGENGNGEENKTGTYKKQENTSFTGSRMLTPSEIESLRQEAKRDLEHLKRLHPKEKGQFEKTQTEPQRQLRKRVLSPSEIEALREEGKKADEYFRKVFQGAKDTQKH